MTRQQHKKKKSKGRIIKNILINLLLLIMLLIGLLLIFNNKVKDVIVEKTTEKYKVHQVTPEQIKKNEKQEDVSFDFKDVVSLDLETVVSSRFIGYQTAYTIGGIAMPEIGLNLPILKGVDNYSLIVGAGTMKEDQKMGKGNYALASHNMLERNLLFGALVNAQIGQTIYLTDLENIYVYTVTYKEYVEPTRTDLIEDHKNKTEVTLVTCDATGANRLIVQGEFVKKVKNKDATNDMFNAFELETNTYK